MDGGPEGDGVRGAGGVGHVHHLRERESEREGGGGESK